MASRVVIYAPGVDGDFASYTYDDVTGDVLQLAVGSLVQGPTGTATLTGNGQTFTAPDTDGNQVVPVSGLTVSLPGGGPGNFSPSYSH